MEGLDSIALKYKTDKSSLHHNYTPAYERITSSIKATAKGVLEIGIYFTPSEETSARSLKMWREWFSNATIVGIDIDERYKYDFGERINCVFGDCNKKSVLDKAISFLPSLDFVVDDASHILRYAFGTFQYLFTKLAPGGIYCIEDVLHGSDNKFDNHRFENEAFILSLLRDIEHNGRKFTNKYAADFNKINPDIVMNYMEQWIDHIEIYRGIYAIFKRK